MRVLPMGPAAVLVDDVADPAGWSLGLRRLGIAGVLDVVPAARTVLVRVDDPDLLAGLVDRLADVAPEPADASDATVVEIDVRYDGPDLADVARGTGLSVDEVVDRHSAADYRVAFCGFAPGFGYLRGLPPDLHLPRRATPRTRVPAGSVAIAAEFSAVYPRASPGGWHLLGTATVTLFDPMATPPALLAPGTGVRFVPR